jgi:hypothetical protein
LNISNRLVWASLGLLLIVIGTLAALILRRGEPTEREVVRFSLVVPEGATIGHNVVGRGSGGPAPQFAFAPDSHRLAYVMFSTGATRNV